MKSKAKSVEEYLSELPPDRRKIILQLKEIVQDAFPGLMASESMSYGMPMYENSKGKLGFASQKTISVFICTMLIVTKYGISIKTIWGITNEEKNVSVIPKYQISTLM